MTLHAALLFMSAGGTNGGGFGRGSFFDGTNDFISKGSSMSGSTLSDSGLISLWFRHDSTAADIGDRQLLSTTGIDIYVTSAGSLNVILKNGAPFMSARNTGVLSKNVWRHILVAWQNSVSNTTERYFYLDDALQSWDLVNLDFCDLRGAVGIGAVSGNKKWQGDMTEVYLSDEYLDLTTTANRRKFYSSIGCPVNLGSDGSTPTGSQPLLYLKGTTNPSDLSTNLGSGGTFIETGTLTSSSSNPC